jgi:hypothetical protein
VRSKEEAIEWVKRAQFDGGDELEIRQVFEPEEISWPSSDARPRHVPNSSERNERERRLLERAARL